MPDRNGVRFVASPAPRDAWQRLAAADPDAMPSQTPEWVRTLPSQWQDASRLYETTDGRQIVLPLATRRRPPRSAVAGSYPPRLGFGGFVAERGISPDDVGSVLAHLTSDRRFVLAIWPNPLQAATWAAAVPRHWSATPRRAEVIDLAGGADAVWGRMAGNARRGVRRAERLGVTVETASSSASLQTFFDLFAQSQARWARSSHEPLWLARWRSRADNPATWSRVTSVLGERCRVSIARWEGRPVAGIIVLHGPNAHYTHGAMHDDAGRCYANYALHWHEIAYSIARGERHYHMGESGTSASLARFKQQFGARTLDYADYRYERIPVSGAGRLTRSAVKRMIRYREPSSQGASEPMRPHD